MFLVYCSHKWVAILRTCQQDWTKEKWTGQQDWTKEKWTKWKMSITKGNSVLKCTVH